MDTGDKFYIQSINRALAIVDAVYKADAEGVKLKEISKQVGLPISTAYRIIQNLVSWSYIEEREDGSYTLGMELAVLGAKARQENFIVAIAKPHLALLSEQSGQTVYLALLDKTLGQVVYIDKIDNKGIIQLASSVGSRNFIHATANGKILASGMADDDIRQILHQTGMPPMTENTLKNVKDFLQEIHNVRLAGYAVDLEENEHKVICLAAPIRDHSGEIIASVSISGIDGITIKGDPTENAEMVMRAARGISSDMGFKG